MSHAVAAWALEWGEHRDMRIALCGYEGEHAIPASWECVEWKARGGYGSQGNGSGREICGARAHLVFAALPEAERAPFLGIDGAMSDCQVGLLCEDSDSCRRRASAALPPEGGSTK